MNCCFLDKLYVDYELANKGDDDINRLGGKF